MEDDVDIIDYWINDNNEIGYCLYIKEGKLYLAEGELKKWKEK